MKLRDLVAWLLALATVGLFIAGAFVTLAALRPDPVRFESTDVTGVAWGRELHLLDEDGKARALSDFRGKVVALYFGYTRCPDVCPLAMATLAQAVQLLGADGARVEGVFVTVDPKHDSAKVLANYVRSFHEDFIGLHGDRAATARTAREFRIEAGMHHSSPVFLFDPSGRLRLVAHAEASAQSIAHDMRALLREDAAERRMRDVLPVFAAR